MEKEYKSKIRITDLCERLAVWSSVSSVHVSYHTAYIITANNNCIIHTPINTYKYEYFFFN